MTALSDLSTRVLQAEGPSRELDFWLSYHLGDPWVNPSGLGVQVVTRIERGDYEWRLFGPDDKSAGWLGDHEVPRCTASVDRVLILVGEKLPEWWPELIMRQSYSDAKVCTEGNRAFYARAATPALALLSALLLVLQEKEGSS